MPKARSPPSWPSEAPFDDELLRRRVDLMRRLAVHRVTDDLRRLAVDFRGTAQADVDVAVSLVIRVERQADREAVDLQEHLRVGRLLIVGDGQQATRSGPEIEMLEYEQAIGSWLRGHRQGLLDRQPGKGAHGLVGKRRFRRSDHSRVVPRDALAETEGLPRPRGRAIGGGRAIIGRARGRDGSDQENKDKDARRRHGRVSRRQRTSEVGQIPIDASAQGENRRAVGSRSAKSNRTMRPPPRSRSSTRPGIGRMGSINGKGGEIAAGSTLERLAARIDRDLVGPGA